MTGSGCVCSNSGSAPLTPRVTPRVTHRATHRSRVDPVVHRHARQARARHSGRVRHADAARVPRDCPARGWAIRGHPARSGDARRLGRAGVLPERDGCVRNAGTGVSCGRSEGPRWARARGGRPPETMSRLRWLTLNPTESPPSAVSGLPGGCGGHPGPTVHAAAAARAAPVIAAVLGW